MVVLILDKSKNYDFLYKDIEKYSKEEFEFIISLLPHSNLVEPIKKYNKEFSKEIMGFRPGGLPAVKLQNIYYTRVYIKKDPNIIKHTQMLVRKYLHEIEKVITEKVDSFVTILSKVEKNDMESFNKLIDILLGTKLKENVNLYFKMVGCNLTDEQKNYLNSGLKEKILYQNLESKIKNNLSIIYERKIKEVENNYKSILDEKECKIKLLDQKLKDDKKYFDFELENENAKSRALKQNYEKTENELLDKIEKLKYKINDLQLQSESFKEECAVKENKIKELSNLLELKYDEFNEVANARWIKNNEKLLQDKGEIEKSIDELKIMKDEILREINLLNLSKCDLGNKLIFLEDRSKNFIFNLQGLLNTIGIKQISSKEESKIYHIAGNELEIEQEIIDVRSDFLEDLSINLQVCGIKNEYTFDLAEYIYATFANKMSLLLVGYNTRIIANAISFIVGGSSADIISLPLGYNDCNELISTVNKSKGRVVLIENAVDNISESIYMPLIKQNTDKLFIFSMESSENLPLIPKSILNYMMMVDIDILMEYESDYEFQSCIVDEDIFNINIDEAYKRNNLKYINDLDNAINLNNILKLKLAEVMSIIDKLSSRNSMYDILLFSMYMLCQSKGKIDEFNEFVEKQEFSPVIYKMLQSALGDGLSNE